MGGLGEAVTAFLGRLGGVEGVGERVGEAAGDDEASIFGSEDYAMGSDERSDDGVQDPAVELVL